MATPPGNTSRLTVRVERLGQTPETGRYWIESDHPVFGIGLPLMEYTPSIGDSITFYWEGPSTSGTRPVGCSINGGPFIRWKGFLGEEQHGA